jgi:hypothetical protein
MATGHHLLFPQLLVQAVAQERLISPLKWAILEVLAEDHLLSDPL